MFINDVKLLIDNRILSDYHDFISQNDVKLFVDNRKKSDYCAVI